MDALLTNVGIQQENKHNNFLSDLFKVLATNIVKKTIRKHANIDEKAIFAVD